MTDNWEAIEASAMAKRKRTHCILTFSLFLLTIISEASFSMARQFPTGVIFHEDTLYRSDARGDNWCITWVADDSQITSMCDGNWLKGKHSYHNHLYRITGGPQIYCNGGSSGGLFDDFAGIKSNFEINK